jgi:hypothetical protein
MRPTRSIAVAAALALLFAVDACGETIDKSAINGATSCREWSALRDEGYTKATELWLSGLLMNLAASDDPKVVDDEALIASTAWMDDFCRRNPVSTIGEAALIRYDELKRRFRQRKQSAR